MVERPAPRLGYLLRAARLRDALHCRLCWRVTFAVFCLILLIESFLLVPSVLRFERVELQRLCDIAVASLDGLLATEPNGLPRARLQSGLDRLVHRGALAGVTAYRADGARIAAAGEATDSGPALAPSALGVASKLVTRASRGGRAEFAWRSDAGGTPVVLVARIDTSSVPAEVGSYVLRIAGLVALIVLVVTVGTMLVLHLYVLRPILLLRESSVQAGKAPGHADEFAVRVRRRDELGEVMTAHNAMLASVADSKRRDREIADERARYLTRHEALTGMPNRAALIEHVERQQTVGGPTGGTMTLALVNVVKFRQVNAGLGQRLGDEFLREFARRLKQVAEVQDFVAHLGADRFAVARSGAHDASAAAALAERILRDITAPFKLSGSPTHVDVRIGIAHRPVNDATGEELINQAEIALDRASGEAAGRYHFFEPSMAEEAQLRQVLAHELETALRGDELFLVFQPKFSIDDSGPAPTLIGAEALLRWKSPARGFVRPDVFIPIAEATGLILPVGEFVLRAACAQIKAWLSESGWSPRIAVNLSAHQFAEPGLASLIMQVLDDAGVPADRLELEVTESAAMRDVAKTAATLPTLRALGVTVSIDDFGTGYSSLNYLRRFDIDTIKIDKSFVDDIGADANAEAICDAIIVMGRSLGKRVIAEGVEYERQLEFLRSRGCHEIQGYLLGRPAPASEFAERYLAASRVT